MDSPVGATAAATFVVVVKEEIEWGWHSVGAGVSGKWEMGTYLPTYLPTSSSTYTSQNTPLACSWVRTRPSCSVRLHHGNRRRLMGEGTVCVNIGL